MDQHRDAVLGRVPLAKAADAIRATAFAAAARTDRVFASESYDEDDIDLDDDSEEEAESTSSRYRFIPGNFWNFDISERHVRAKVVEEAASSLSGSLLDGTFYPFARVSVHHASSGT